MHISIGTDKNDLKRFRATPVGSIESLAKLITSINYSLATFKDDIRNKANFIQTEAIGLDFDENYTLDQAMTDFAEYRHIIAPTRSHQKQKNGVVCDRFRVILFLSYPITNSDIFEATWHSLAERWPATDRQCKDESRFFYPSVNILDLKTTGFTVDPVTPKPRESTKGEVDLFLLSASDRGKLGKPTLDFLATGPVKGERNQSTVRAAKDFQQNLYTVDEASDRILSALKATDSIARDFTESEVLRTVRSAYNSDPRHDPRIRQKAFNLVPIGELYKTRKEVEWVVEGLLTVGGVSLMSSDPKAGKSTLVRQLIKDVLRGSKFLERQCKHGSVHYYGIEEQLEVVNASFSRLGVTKDDALLVHVGDPLADTKMEDFRDLLLETRPVIAVIDTLFDFLDVESENNYKEVKRELRRLRQVARETGTHVMCIHHSSKGSKDDRRRGNRSILGSQAIAGGVDTIAVIEVEGSKRLISTTGREIRRWVNREIVFNQTDCTYTLGPQMDEF